MLHKNFLIRKINIFDKKYNSLLFKYKICNLCIIKQSESKEMGGHGGLNILPQKKWNVYNHDNRAIVDRDKKAAE